MNLNYYCTIDGNKYINKEIIVIGGRNSGAAAACYLHDLGCKVCLIEIKDKIQAKDKYQNRLDERGIKIITSAKLEKLDRDENNLEKVFIRINNRRKLDIIPAKGIFVYIGREPNIDFCKVNIRTDKDGYLLVDHYNQTSIQGLFAAGDITSRLKQVITACGDGANAYYFAEKYINSLSN